MADTRRAAANQAGDRKKQAIHRKGEVKKMLPSSKTSRSVISSAAARLNQKKRVIPSNKVKIKKNVSNFVSGKSSKFNENNSNDSKPIEALMAALATMPSLNVDELVKHYIDAKETTLKVGKRCEVKNGKLAVKSNKKETKAPVAKKVVKKKPKTPIGIKVEKVPFARPYNAAYISKLGPSDKSTTKVVQRKKPVPKANIQPVKEIKPVIVEEEEEEEAPPEIAQVSEVTEDLNIPMPEQNTIIVQTAQVVQNSHPLQQSYVEKEPVSLLHCPHLSNTKFTIEVPKSPPIKSPEGTKEEISEDKKSENLIGLYVRRQELIEKEFQSVCQFVNRKKYNQLKIIADEAIKNETTFAICGHSNGYQTVKKYFQSRGWVERFANPDEKPLQYNNLIPGPDNETIVLSKLISRMPVKFIWAEGVINWSNIVTSTIVNKYPYSSRSISTKTGLLQYLQNQHWTYSANFAYVKYPRTVSITNEDDMKYFATQYRISACVSMLKHFVESYDDKKELIVEHGVIPIECLDFAVQRVCEFVTFEEGTDVDHWNISMVTEDDWILFLLRFLDVAHFNAKYKNNCDYNIPKLIECARKCVNRVRDIWPDIDHEGVKNLWMVKPGASSCGRGIRIFKSLVEIANHCKPGFSYIAQKYIERPMIIHKTKFDIRQWFLVTSIQPMVVYMYDLCYLRFCSKEFSLVNLHESVHLSNNSVQCRYQNVSTRSGELPADNMWDCDQFLSYLRGRKEVDKWFAITLPGMRKGIVGALLASQESMLHRANCFNLYGADFMLTEDFVPWLIEINAGPCLRSTTSVTSRLCPMVIEDTLNLALKKKDSNGALACGHFRLVYSQKAFQNAVNQKDDIRITGKRAKIFTPKSFLQNSLGITQVPSKDLSEDVDSPLTYEGRTLNYERLSFTYKKHLKVEMKPTLAPYVSRQSPLGPGSILSRFELTYKKTFPFQGDSSVYAVKLPLNGTSALTSILPKPPPTIAPTTKIMETKKFQSDSDQNNPTKPNAITTSIFPPLMVNEWVEKKVNVTTV